MTKEEQLRKLFNYVDDNTSGDTGESGGCYIDFYNGLSISKGNIENWIDECYELWDKVDLIEEEFEEENMNRFNLDCDKEARDKLIDNLIDKCNLELEKILKTNHFNISRYDLQFHFNLERYILFKAKEIEETITPLIDLKDTFLEKDTMLSDINHVLNNLGYIQVTYNDEIFKLEECVWYKKDEEPIVFKFKIDDNEIYVNNIYFGYDMYIETCKVFLEQEGEGVKIIIDDEYVSTISSLELYDSINKAEQKLKEYGNLKEVDFCYYEYVSEYSLDELKEKLNNSNRE